MRLTFDSNGEKPDKIWRNRCQTTVKHCQAVKRNQGEKYLFLIKKGNLSNKSRQKKSSHLVAVRHGRRKKKGLYIQILAAFRAILVLYNAKNGSKIERKRNLYGGNEKRTGKRRAA